MAGAVVLCVFIVAVAIAGVVAMRAPIRKVRRRDHAAAVAALNEVGAIVDRYHSQLDVVGDAMAGEIRTQITTYRKEINR